jgi:hypothetical protein
MMPMCATCCANALPAAQTLTLIAGDPATEAFPAKERHNAEFPSYRREGGAVIRWEGFAGAGCWEKTDSKAEWKLPIV